MQRNSSDIQESISGDIGHIGSIFSFSGSKGMEYNSNFSTVLYDRDI